MSDVFVSYKREDETRVGRLVQALQAEGLDIWWDRGLAGGEPWRTQIAEALNQSKCTVVVWTHAATGSGGQFVWDEASRARSKNQLLPVALDRVLPPLGFGELQSIDLTRWRGKRSDPFFRDLVAAIRAKMEGRTAPAPRGPTWRLRRRLTAGGIATTSTALLAALASNTLGLQDRLCVAGFGQPVVSDACGALGLGSRPSRSERVAWDSRAQGDCEGLRQHLRSFPNGVHRAEAQALLAARKVTVEEVWKASPNPQPLRLLVDSNAAGSPTESASQQAALERGVKKGERLCRDFDVAGLTRFMSVEVKPQEWQCSRVRGLVICGFDGQAICWQQVVDRFDREICSAEPRP